MSSSTMLASPAASAPRPAPTPSSPLGCFLMDLICDAPFTIVQDNARLPSESLLRKSHHPLHLASSGGNSRPPHAPVRVPSNDKRWTDAPNNASVGLVQPTRRVSDPPQAETENRSPAVGKGLHPARKLPDFDARRSRPMPEFLSSTSSGSSSSASVLSNNSTSSVQLLLDEAIELCE